MVPADYLTRIEKTDGKMLAVNIKISFHYSTCYQ